MNQNSQVVSLRKLAGVDRPFGNVLGKEVFRKLTEVVESHPQSTVFGISLKDIKATDASFPRESVVALAKHFRGERGVFLQDFEDRDLIDNWDYAARAKDQPLVIWNGGMFTIIGPEMNQATRTLVSYVLENGAVLASQAAADLGLSVQNASTRLKNLVTAGYLLRSEDVAESGGIEFKYRAIR